MGLARVTTQLATTIIRMIGDDGGTLRRDVESELDNLIAWAKVSPRCIKRDTSTVGNVGTGVDDLHTFTLPANSLAVDGDYLTIDYLGNFAANDDNKRVMAVIDGTTYEDGLAAPVDLDGGANNGWRFLNRIIRISSTQVRVASLLAAQFIQMDSAGTVTAPGTAGYLQLNRDVLVTVANLNSNGIVLKCQAESATATNNNIVQHMSIIELTQQ